MDRPIAVITGWWLLEFLAGWFACSFIWAFVRAIYRALQKADATFDQVVQTAVENFPNSYIWVRRGPWFFIDHISATVVTTTADTDMTINAHH